MLPPNLTAFNPQARGRFKWWLQACGLMKRLYYALRTWTPMLNLLWWLAPGLCRRNIKNGLGWAAWSIPWGCAWTVAGCICEAHRIYDESPFTGKRALLQAGR